MKKYCSYCMSEIIGEATRCPVCGQETEYHAPAHHLLPGTVLNKKFYVGRALGEGGFGITYVGRDITLDMKIAIKEYYPNGYVNRSNTISPRVNDSVTGGRKEFFEKGRERFLKEARILAKFYSEAGIVNVHDFFEENNTAYIIMEYLEGIDLKHYLNQKGTLTPEQTVQLLMPVMNSLKKVHAQGLIHRDISPDNIMISGNTVKLLDFGAARSVSAEANKSLSVMLKPGYAPEEQYRSKGNQGPWTDIYALCATMYKCITGITPDDATQRVFSDEVKTPSALGISIQPEIEKAIMRGMSVLQKDRYQSIEDLLRGLQGIPVEINAGGQTVAAGRRAAEEDSETQYMESAGEAVTALGSEKAAETEDKTIFKPAEASKPVEEVKPMEASKPVEEVKPAEEAASGQKKEPVKKSEGKPQPSALTEKKGKEAAAGTQPVAAKGSVKAGNQTKNTKKQSSPGKKKALLGGIIGAAALAAALVLILVIRYQFRDTFDPSISGYLMRNKDSIEWIEPGQTLDAKSIYDTLSYTEAMFYGSYTISPNEENDDELTQYMEESGYGLLTDIGFSDKYMTNLPYKIEAGPKSFAHSLQENKEHSWMRLYYYTEDGYMNFVEAAYEVEGNKLKITPVMEYDRDAGILKLAPKAVEYGFSFDGIVLTLSYKNESVKLEADGFQKEIVDNDYHKYYNIHTSAVLSEGSKQIDAITGIDFYFSKEDSYFNLDEKDRDIDDGIAKMTQDGLFTFSYTDGHAKNTRYFTHQFVFFFCDRDGLILTDGKNTYYYLGDSWSLTDSE